MMDQGLNLTPAEEERFDGYHLTIHFTHGYDDIVLDQPNVRRPHKSDIKATRAYNYGRECALMRQEHHASHRGLNHKHECFFCHFTWWHSEGSLDCQKCHTCPQCHAAHQDTVMGWLSIEEEKKFLLSKVRHMVSNYLPTESNVVIVDSCIRRLIEIGVQDVTDIPLAKPSDAPEDRNPSRP